MTIMTISAVPFPVFSPCSLLPILASSLEQSAPSNWILHHSLESLLLLPLDRENRIITYLARSIPQRVRVLQRHEGFLRRRLLQPLALFVFQQSVDPSLAEQISFHLLGHPCLPCRRAAVVHPIDPIKSLLPAGGLLHLLQFLDLTLFGPLLDHLVDPLALLERLLLLLPYFSLVRKEVGVPLRRELVYGRRRIAEHNGHLTDFFKFRSPPMVTAFQRACGIEATLFLRTRLLLVMKLDRESRRRISMVSADEVGFRYLNWTLPS